MRLSKALVPTLKEAPAEAEVPSHIIMVRGGYLRKVAAGVYSFLPLGWRVIKKIERIIREEMDRTGASEVFLPAVVPAELWQESGRWDKYGAQLLRFKDRKGGDFVIGPTHEEVIVDLVRGDVRSYRQLPLNLYQIQTKFRDELRPRAGLMRGREFIMEDAYSFQVLTDTGEDVLVACDKCNYAANVEQADNRIDGLDKAALPPATEALAKVATPGKGSIEDVSAFLKLPPTRFVKTLIYLADGKPVAALVRGDRTVNEIKL